MTNIKSVKNVGYGQTYDLEVDHPDHQFYLSNGMLTSNSHAVLYSLTSYKTAYLKAHFPVEFLLANLMAEVKSNSPDAKSNIEKIKKELRQNNVNILPPDLNSSQLSYALSENTLITGLDALKFVGDEAIKDIIQKRPFKDFNDFMVRVDSKKVRANNIQALAASGALSSFNLSRKLIFLYVSDYRKKLQVWLKKHDPTKEQFVYPWPNEKEWNVQELYALEQFYMNESFTCKPSTAYGSFFKDRHLTISEIKKAQDKTVIPSIKVILRDFYEFKIKKETSKYYGHSMLKTLVEDKNGDQCSCTIFPKQWEALKNSIRSINSKIKFEPGIALHFSGTVNIYDDDIGIIFENLFNVAGIPALPDDLKAKKVNLKDAKKAEESKNTNDINTLFEQIEDSLYNEGLIDLDDNEDI